MTALKPRVSPKRVVELTPEMVRLWRVEGLTTGQIAKRVDLGQNVVTLALQRAGVYDGRRQQKTAPHGAPARWMEGCRCDECLEGRRAYKRAERDRLGPTTDPETLRERTAERQARTVEKAQKSGRQWTGTEVEIAARDDLRIEDAATMLGRTYAAVSNVRAALADPAHPAHRRYWTLLEGP